MNSSGFAPLLTPVWGGDSPAQRPEQRPALAGPGQASIVIVGGGVAGLSLALHLAEAGETPVLVEAGRIGDGATGFSAGVVAPQLVRTTPDAVLRKLGPDHGSAILRLVGDSGTYLFDLIARHGIACEASQRGFLAAATGGDAGRKLADRVAQWAPFRGDLSVCDAGETRRLTGCRGYGAAILDRSGGAIDPLLFARGLADRAEAAGAVIHENSAVSSVHRKGADWVVTTAAGSIVAPRVVLAANGGNGQLHPALAGTVLPLPVCQVATEPLPAAMRTVTLPEGHSMTDLEADVFSIRYDAHGRLITAFPASDAMTPAQITDAVNGRLAKMLVAAQPLRLDNIWRGTAWVNSSLLPRLVGVEDGLIAVQACNGRGLGVNTILGRELARRLVEPASPACIPLEPPQRVAGFALARHLPRLLMSLALVTKRARQQFAR